MKSAGETESNVDYLIFWQRTKVYRIITWQVIEGDWCAEPMNSTLLIVTDIEHVIYGNPGLSVK